MEPTAAIIPARSERQALDWSLVLVSQGIETRIERGGENQGWQLMVDPPDHERAFTAIRHYRAENRGRPWLQELPWSGLIFDLRGLAWFGLPVICFVLSETRFLQLKNQEESTNSLLTSRNTVLERLAYYQRLLGLQADPSAKGMTTADLTREELTEENFDQIWAYIRSRAQ
jgi:hypothetical protein